MIEKKKDHKDREDLESTTNMRCCNLKMKDSQKRVKRKKGYQSTTNKRLCNLNVKNSIKGRLKRLPRQCHIHMSVGVKCPCLLRGISFFVYFLLTHGN